MGKNMLIIGAKGALGSALLEGFKKEGFWVATIDQPFGLTQPESNESALSIYVDSSLTSMEQQRAYIQEKFSQDEKLGSGTKFDLIICVAGGWTGGNVADDNFLRNATLMWGKCVQPSLLSVSIATNYLNQGGLLILTGAMAALDPTPGMVAYGLAKSAVHHLTRSLGGEGSGLPCGAKALAILPMTLDTSNNRKWIPDADYRTWTPLEHITGIFLTWVEDIGNAPKSGSLVSLITKNGETTTEIN